MSNQILAEQTRVHKVGSMLRHLRPRRSGRGQSAVEVALMAPALVLLLVTVSDAGRMFFTYLQVFEAARAGAQYGAQNFTTAGDNSGMQSHALNAAPNLSGLAASATNFCCCPDSSGSSCTNFSGGSGSSTYTQSCGAQPPCSDWRRYEVVSTRATFNTILGYPGIPKSLSFGSTCTLRSR